MNHALKTDSSFEAAFGREVLASEKLRATILSGCFVVGGSWILLFPQLTPLRFPVEDSRLILNMSLQLWLALYLALLACYEFGFSRVMAFFIRANRPFITRAFYANALVETSAPTIGLYLSSKVLGIEALFFPMVFLYFLFIVLSSLRLNPRLCLFTGAVAGAGYLAVSWMLIAKAGAAGAFPLLAAKEIHVSRAGVILLCALAASFVAREIRGRAERVFASRQERDRMEKTFGQHVSPEVVERLLQETDALDTETRNVCVMFLDIRGFTRFSEPRTPVEVVRYLNSLFDFMISIVNRRHGIINKFLGDGFLAVFGAPFSFGNDCENAALAALDIIARIEQDAAAGLIPETRVGIGLSAGPAVTGTIGSPLRREYTVIGDVVNVASRVEKLNKALGTQFLVTGEVWDKIKGAVPMKREIGPVDLPGRGGPVLVYQLA